MSQSSFRALGEGAEEGRSGSRRLAVVLHTLARLHATAVARFEGAVARRQFRQAVTHAAQALLLERLIHLPQALAGPSEPKSPAPTAWPHDG